MTMKNNPRGTENTPFVALVDNATSYSIPNHNHGHEILSLTDPCTKQDRQYIRSHIRGETSSAKSQICEVQNVPHSKSIDFSSFFVGSRVISNPALHLVTPVDPLFLLLPYFEPSQEQHQLQQQEEGKEESLHKWQPWDQICSSKNISPTILNALKTRSVNESVIKSQLGHLFAINNLYGEDMILHKFQKEKALEWLRKKMAKVELFLEAQIIIEKGKQKVAMKKLDAEGGAFCSTFCLADNGNKDGDESKKDTHIVAEEKTTYSADENEMEHDLTAMEKASVSKQAAQIICEYLSPYWQSEFLTFIHLTHDILYGSKKKKLISSPCTVVSDKSITPPSKDQNAVAVTPLSKGTKRSLYESNMSEADKLLQYTMGGGSAGDSSMGKNENGSDKKKKHTAKSSGLKRLEKVNTKGMKTMASFFSVKKKMKKG